jgi:hypothetical protein
MTKNGWKILMDSNHYSDVICYILRGIVSADFGWYDLGSPLNYAMLDRWKEEFPQLLGTNSIFISLAIS